MDMDMDRERCCQVLPSAAKLLQEGRRRSPAPFTVLQCGAVLSGQHLVGCLVRSVGRSWSQRSSGNLVVSSPLGQTPLTGGELFLGHRTFVLRR